MKEENYFMVKKAALSRDLTIRERYSPYVFNYTIECPKGKIAKIDMVCLEIVKLYEIDDPYMHLNIVGFFKDIMDIRLSVTSIDTICPLPQLTSEEKRRIVELFKMDITDYAMNKAYKDLKKEEELTYDNYAKKLVEIALKQHGSELKRMCNDMILRAVSTYCYDELDGRTEDDCKK